MIRTQIYLTMEEKRGLESVAISAGISQSDLIRQAIDALLAKSGSIDKIKILDEIAGIWSEREDPPKLSELREGWHRRPVR